MNFANKFFKNTIFTLGIFTNLGIATEFYMNESSFSEEDGFSPVNAYLVAKSEEFNRPDSKNFPKFESPEPTLKLGAFNRPDSKKDKFHSSEFDSQGVHINSPKLKKEYDDDDDTPTSSVADSHQKETEKEQESPIINLERPRNEIICLQNVKDIMNLAAEFYCQNFDSATLFVFDCDDVLQRYRDATIDGALIKKLNEKCPEKQEFANNVSTLFLEAEIKVVDKKMVEFVGFIQEILKSRALVLSQCGTGQLGNIASMVDWRINALKQLGYDFASSWGDIPEKEFQELNTNSPRFIPTGTIPVFKKGIACACDVDKGEFLIKVLDYIKSQDSTYFPKKIFYVDDSMKQVESVAAAAKKLNMDFIGVQYITSKHNTGFDPIAETKLEYLKKGIVITDLVACVINNMNLVFKNDMEGLKISKQ